MMMMSLISMIMILIPMIMMKISMILSKKSFMDREKCSPFECGFDPKSSSRTPFSLRFFLIAIIFLIFDVEITLILPMIMILKYSNMMYWSITSLIFMIILLFGLYHEWNQGMLNWAK